MARIKERQLILPSLFLIDLSPQKQLTTTELQQGLRDLLNPTGEDLETLANRNDDKFSQKVRNLRSHKTFEKLGVAEYNDENAAYRLTPKGKKYLTNNFDKLYYLIVNNFNWEDLKEGLEIVSPEQKRDIEVFDENYNVREGMNNFAKRKIYERSSKLRKSAIEHYTYQNDIVCDACKFSFKKFYGDIGDRYIEIHHIKPIFKYEEEDLKTTIEDALENVVPVCSNCHRMIHKNWRNPLEMSYLKQQIAANGIYTR